MNRGIDMPNPTPSTIMAYLASISVELTVIRDIMYEPSTNIDNPRTPRTRYRPTRERICPVIALDIAIAIIIGIVTRPELVAEAPITPCTSKGM
jgi:hypothetical protein